MSVLQPLPKSPLLKAVVAFDLVVTLALAIPVTSTAFLWLVDSIGQLSGLAAPLPEPQPVYAMFINLAGVLGVCWNAVRWRYSARELAAVDAWARIAVAALILYYVARGATPVLLLFVLSEGFGAAVEWRLLRRSPRSPSTGTGK